MNEKTENVVQMLLKAANMHYFMQLFAFKKANSADACALCLHLMVYLSNE